MSEAPKTEILLDGAAAAWLGGCLGIALIVAGPALDIAKAAAIAPAWASAAAWAAYRCLAALRGPRNVLLQFEIPPIIAVEPEMLEEPLKELLLTSEMAVLTSELLLTRGQMLSPPADQPSEPLLLDDVLAELRPDARVVQLFDPARMPTAGELRSRIDRHLGEAGRGASLSPQPDASQALYDALADLRRSLA